MTRKIGARILSALMAAVLVVGLTPVAPSPAYADLGATMLAAGGTSATSGTAGLATRTEADIAARWKALPAEPTGMTIFATLNDNGAYTPSQLTPAALEYAEAYLDFIRYSAGLSPVTLTDELNANAAQGALIMAASGTFSHTPPTPEGATDAQAEPGKYACATSNISYAGSYPDAPDALRMAIQGQMDDSESVDNLSVVGHRRWLLDPETSTMGFGTAYATAYDSRIGREISTMYSAVRVFTNPYSAYYDASYGIVGQDGATDYDFVAWPASGAFASNVFAMGTPWSVTLNPEAYRTPAADDLQVSVTRTSDNATWTLTSADGTPSKSEGYLLVNAQGTGVPNCIIFNPGSDNVGAAAYSGTYRVNITGLKAADGTDTSLSYEVDFFDADGSGKDPAGPAGPSDPSGPGPADPTEAANAPAQQVEQVAQVAQLMTPKITVSKKSKTVKLKAAKRKAQSFKIGARSSSGGKLTYKMVKRDARLKFKAGTLTLRKGTGKGTYYAKVKVSSAARGAYTSGSATFKLSFKVK